MRFDPRGYQLETVEAWYPDILEEGTHPLVALPTGSGKSVILGILIQRYLKEFPDNQVLVLSHTQEIVAQDHEAMQEFFPNEHIGIYSAGLGSKDIEQITIGGIQSVIRAKDKFKWVNLVVVDEAQSVNHKNAGNYRKLFKSMVGATFAGMSATVFRSGHGYLHEGTGTLFNKLSHDLTSTFEFNKLVKAGYLCDLISVAPKTQLDSSGVKKSAGDYNIKDLANAHDKNEVTSAAVEDALYYGKHYSKWLCFAIDVAHCEHVAAELNRNGISARVLHSRMDADREHTILDFKAGKFKALVSVGMVTTGFDVLDIDLILLLRPTMSAVLHVQMVGRGLRVHPSKKHCLVLDYAGNTARLGPINNVTIPKKKGEKGGGEAPTKTCPVCNTITYTMAKHCDSCGHEFVFESKLTTQSDGTDIIARDTAKETNAKWLNVTRMTYRLHQKQGAPDSVLVTYFCGLTTVKEWVCPSNVGYAGYKAKHWLEYRNYNGPLVTNLVLKNCSKLRQPTQILVDFAPKYPNILNSRFE